MPDAMSRPQRTAALSSPVGDADPAVEPPRPNAMLCVRSHNRQGRVVPLGAVVAVDDPAVAASPAAFEAIVV